MVSGIISIFRFNLGRRCRFPGKNETGKGKKKEIRSGGGREVNLEDCRASKQQQKAREAHKLLLRAINRTLRVSPPPPPPPRPPPPLSPPAWEKVRKGGKEALSLSLSSCFDQCSCVHTSGIVALT